MSRTWWPLKMLALSTSCSADHVPNLAAHKRWIKITSFIALGMIVVILRATVLEEQDPADIIRKPTVRNKVLKKKAPPAFVVNDDFEPAREAVIHTTIGIEESDKKSSIKPDDIQSTVKPKEKQARDAFNAISKESTESIEETGPADSDPSEESKNDGENLEVPKTIKKKTRKSVRDSKEIPKSNKSSTSTPKPVNSSKPVSKNSSDAKTDDGESKAASKQITEHKSSTPTVDSTPYALNTTFVDEWCELQGAEWHPSGDNSWQRRAPYFLLPGAKKSGTTSLAQYIMQHPQVAPARTKELQFFLNKNFRGKFVTGSGKTAVKSARQVMYARDYHHKVYETDSSLISFDGTPGYLFFSTMLPQRILCVCPWVKLVIILRNPVDRAYSNWAYAVRRVNLKLSFEDWIEEDFGYMKEAGLVHDWREVDFNAFAGSQQEDEAWSNYLRLTGEGPIGRGMYELQLRHWFKALKDIGRDPKTEVLILRTEDVRNDVDSEYRKVTKFLGLPDHKLGVTQERVVSNYTATMNTTTRELLEKFYEPYNKRLCKLLGGDWKGYWDPNEDKS